MNNYISSFLKQNINEKYTLDKCIEQVRSIIKLELAQNSNPNRLSNTNEVSGNLTKFIQLVLSSSFFLIHKFYPN